jgi:hypothetical protein
MLYKDYDCKGCKKKRIRAGHEPQEAWSQEIGSKPPVLKVTDSEVRWGLTSRLPGHLTVGCDVTSAAEVSCETAASQRQKYGS